MRVRHTRVANVPVALSTEQDLTDILVEDTMRYREGTLEHPLTMLSCNGQSLSLYAQDKAFAAAIDDADVVHADGQSIVWMSKLFGQHTIPERTATTDFIHAAGRAAAEHGLSFYLLGAPEEINAKCAEKLIELYPGLKIAGRQHGYFGEDEEASVIEDINNSNADVLWIGLGKPREQHFAMRERKNLKCAWIVSCGGCFNFVAGDYTRAPMWMQKFGLEWLHRLVTGPKHLIKRYLYTIPHGIGLVLWHDMIRRRGREIITDPKASQPNGQATS